MDFGNDVAAIKRVAVVGLILGLAVGVVATINMGGVEPAKLPWLVMLVLTPSVILSSAVALTSLFKVRVTGEAVKHIFLGRWVLSEYPISTYQRMQYIPPVLIFAGGNKMRLVGMHLALLAKLEMSIRDAQNRPSIRDRSPFQI